MAETLLVRRRVREAVVAHARAASPDESCGLLLGHGLVVDESVPLRNVDAAPRVRYCIDPAEHVAVIRRLRGSTRRIVGCYHSHPRGGARPSPADVAEAYYPDFAWVIVSLAAARPRVRAWRIADGRVRTMRIAVAW